MDLNFLLKNMLSDVKRLQFGRILYSLSSAWQKSVAHPAAGACLLISIVLLGIGLLAWIGILPFVIADAIVVLVMFGVYIAFTQYRKGHARSLLYDLLIICKWVGRVLILNLLIGFVLLGIGLLAWIGIPQFVIADAIVVLVMFGVVYVALNIGKDM